MTARLMTEALEKLIDMHAHLISEALTTLLYSLNVLTPWLSSTSFCVFCFYGPVSAP